MTCSRSHSWLLGELVSCLLAFSRCPEWVRNGWSRSRPCVCIWVRRLHPSPQHTRRWKSPLPDRGLCTQRCQTLHAAQLSLLPTSFLPFIAQKRFCEHLSWAKDWDYAGVQADIILFLLGVSQLVWLILHLWKLGPQFPAFLIFRLASGILKKEIWNWNILIWQLRWKLENTLGQTKEQARGLMEARGTPGVTPDLEGRWGSPERQPHRTEGWERLEGKTLVQAAEGLRKKELASDTWHWQGEGQEPRTVTSLLLPLGRKVQRGRSMSPRASRISGL